MKEGILAIVFMLAIALVALYSVSAFNCWRGWSSSTMEWRIKFGTCQVNHPQHGWVPEARIRITD